MVIYLFATISRKMTPKALIFICKDTRIRLEQKTLYK